MKWMIFSDTHLGSILSKRTSEILDLLKKKTPDLDLLIINGDFLDLWRTTFDKIYQTSTLNHLINFMLVVLPLSGLRVIYIFGNHEDDDIKLLRDKYPDVEFYWNYNVDKIKIIHGHQFDKSYTENRDKLYRSTKIQQFFDTIFRIDIRKLLIKIDKILHTGVYNKFVKEIHDGAVELYSEHYDGIVVSHSHSSSIIKYDNFTVYDTGNTYNQLNYLIFDDNKPFEVEL